MVDVVGVVIYAHIVVQARPTHTGFVAQADVVDSALDAHIAYSLPPLKIFVPVRSDFCAAAGGGISSDWRGHHNYASVGVLKEVVDALGQ